MELRFEHNPARIMNVLMAHEDGKYICDFDGRRGEPLFDLRCDKPPIVIHQKLHEMFCDTIESWKRHDGHYWYRNRGYVLGKNKTGELVWAEQIGEEDAGCGSFINVNGTGPITKPMYLLAKADLIPCGLARVSSLSSETFSNSSSRFYWNQDTPFKNNRDFYYVNYQPRGPHFFTGDSGTRTYNYLIKPNRKVPSVGGCIDTNVGQL